MGSYVYSNQETIENTATTSASTYILKRPSRAIEIINDSSTRTLQYKFKAGHDWASLKANEAVSLEFWTTTIMVRTLNNTAAFRIRVYG